MLKKDKKGFTLAELLIVVAIIAVLTAIAVPLFVGALAKAQEATDQANIRAVRGEAVARILLATEGDTDVYGAPISGKTAALNDTTNYIGWKATATVDKNGKMSAFKVERLGKSAKLEADGVSGTTVTVYITADDLNKTTGA